MVEPADESLGPLGSVNDMVVGGKMVGLMTKQEVIRAEQMGWDIKTKGVKVRVGSGKHLSGKQDGGVEIGTQ